MTTATAPPAQPTRTGAFASRRDALAGMATLTRFILRRDRIRIPLWLGGITAITVASAASFGDLYPTAEARQAIVDTMNTPAGLAMSGPSEYFADYSFGSMMGHQMLGFGALLVAMMSVLLIVRHTRAEEASGRAELVRSSVVGRHAHLVSALVVVTAANVVLALLLTVGLGALGLEGMTWDGSLLYGVGHAAVGVVFAAVAAVTVQIIEHPRGASGTGLALLGLAYVLRAAGDAGNDTLSWLSPIGWAQQTYVYVDDRWWPLLLPAVLTAALLAAAVVLSTRRDVGAGLREPGAGAPAASPALANPWGFALRLHRGLLVGFGAGMALLGVAYGSIMAEVSALLGSMDMLEEALAGIGGTTLVESFSSLIIVIMAIVSSVYVVMAALRARSEESSGRAEPVLATALSRPRWLASHLLVATVGGAGVLLLATLGFGASGAMVLEDSGFLLDVMVAALAYLPALWVTLGVAVALYGLVPRFVAVVWIVPLYAFLVGYLGQILQFPAWMNNLSPFGHVPQVPAEQFTIAPILVLTAVAGALVAAGVVGFRRRDLSTN